MSDKINLFKTITGFLKDNLKPVIVQPEIKMDFCPAFVNEEYRQVLREIWEEVLKYIDDNPTSVVSRNWYNIEWDWERKEKIKIKEGGMVFELSGPLYPMPGAKIPKQQEQAQSMTQEQFSDRQVNQTLPMFLHHLSTASPEKKRAVYVSISAALRGEVTDDELVRKVADDVIRRLVLRNLMKGKEETP